MSDEDYFPRRYREPDENFLQNMLEKQRYTRKPGKKEHPQLRKCLVPGSSPAKYVCPMCKQERSKATWLIHQRHGCNDCKMQAQPKVQCLACQHCFVNRDQMLEHYEELHHSLDIISMTCEDREHFEGLRHQMKIGTGFTMRSTGGKGAASSNRYFRCPESSSCTAFVNTTTLVDGTLSIKFCIYHSHMAGSFEQPTPQSLGLLTYKKELTMLNEYDYPYDRTESAPSVDAHGPLTIPKEENEPLYFDLKSSLAIVKEECDTQMLNNLNNLKKNDDSDCESSYSDDMRPAIELMGKGGGWSSSSSSRSHIQEPTQSIPNGIKRKYYDEIPSPSQSISPPLLQKPAKRMPGFLEAEKNLARLEATKQVVGQVSVEQMDTGTGFPKFIKITFLQKVSSRFLLDHIYS